MCSGKQEALYRIPYNGVVVELRGERLNQQLEEMDLPLGQWVMGFQVALDGREIPTAFARGKMGASIGSPELI